MPMRFARTLSIVADAALQRTHAGMPGERCSVIFSGIEEIRSLLGKQW